MVARWTRQIGGKADKGGGRQTRWSGDRFNNKYDIFFTVQYPNPTPTLSSVALVTNVNWANWNVHSCR